MVTRAMIGMSSSSSRTEVTATPSMPNSRVVSLVKPVAFRRSFKRRNSNDRAAPRAPRYYQDPDLLSSMPDAALSTVKFDEPGADYTP